MTGAAIVKVIWRTLGFTIPLPLGVILAALAWLHFDKESAIRQAVNERVTEMVAGGKIAELEAKLEAEEKIAAARGQAAAEANRRLMAEIDARVNLSRRMAAIQTENEILNDDLADLLSRPVDGDCAVDPDILNRLRGR
jgi:polyhydroxyalkanoate synthesis regulator phasin